MWEFCTANGFPVGCQCDIQRKVRARSGGGLDCRTYSGERGLELQSCRYTDLSPVSPLKGEKIDFSMMGLVVCPFSPYVAG